MREKKESKSSLKRHTFMDYVKSHSHQLTLKRFILLSRPYRDIGRWWDVRLEGFVGSIWYYIKCRFWHQYNVIRIPTLPPTWTDRDEALLHAMFTILVSVVEEEGWLEHSVYYDDDCDPAYDNRDDWQEMAELYDWWINVRPQRLAAEEKARHDWHVEFEKAGGLQFMPPDEFGLSAMKFNHSEAEMRLADISNEMEAAGGREDIEMMVRLCRIRGLLWT